MRIVCPSCQAAYEVPDKLLSSGPRKVRCAKCGGDWMAEAEAEAPPASEAPELPPAPGPRALPAPQEGEAGPDLPPPPVVAPIAAPVVAPVAAPAPAGTVAPRAADKLAPEPEAAPSRRLAVVAGVAWLASVAVLGAAGWAAVAFRADVMAAWGASRRLYALLGLG